MKRRVSLYKLHANQQLIWDDPSRFKVLNCGRRFGKTVLDIQSLVTKALKGYPVAFYGYSYKTLDDTWEEVKQIVAPILDHKDEQIKQIRLINGGAIDFWSSRDPRSGRGKKYKEVIGDEVAFWDNADKIITETIMPTLADYDGSSLLLTSTPYGTNNYWYKLCTDPPKGFKVWNYSIKDNPFISEENIEILKGVTDPKVWDQEYMAEFIDMTADPFFWNYDSTIHQSEYEFEFEQGIETWLSFDFNYDPCVATSYQIKPGYGVIGMREYEAVGGTRALCQRIKTTDIMNVDKSYWIVTGDQSGTSNSAVSGHVNNYTIIQEEFKLRDNQIVNVSSRNKSHHYSRTLCNEALFHIPFVMDKRMKKTGRELRVARPDKAGRLYKNREDGNPMDFCDTYRYFNDAKFYRGIEDILMYKKLWQRAA